jgi:Tol biopolymer transport system component
MRILARALLRLSAALAALAFLPGPLAAQGEKPRKIVFVSLLKGEKKIHLFVMNPDGSGRAPLTKGDALEFDPAVSPDGKRIAFVAAPDEKTKKMDLYVMNADGTGRKRLTENKTNFLAISPCWSADGKRIFFARVNLAKQDGPPDAQIFAIDADGKNLKRVGTVDGIMPSVSPDGKQILYTALGKDTALHVMNADGTGARKLRDKAMMGVWSPDGKKIAYVADAGGKEPALFVSNPDSSGAVRLTKSKGMEFGPQWSPNGKRIYFTRMSNSGTGIYAIDPDGKNEARLSAKGAEDVLGGAVLLLGHSENKTCEKVEEKAGK